MTDQEKKYRKFYTVFGVLFLVVIFGLSAFTLVYPDQDYSSSEKRSLTSFPVLSLDTLADGSFMNGIEDYEADQFPFREQLMQTKSYINLTLGGIRSQNVYYCTDGSLVEAFTMPSQDTLDKQMKAMADFANRYPDLAYYFCLVPNSISVETEKLPKAALTDDQNLYMDAMADAFGQYGTFVDVRALFEKHKNQTELYYNTDHHWTTDAAYLAWQEIYSAMELSSTLTYHSGVVCNTFAGSLLSASGFPAASLDAITIYMPEEDPVYTVTYDNEQRMTASVYSTKHVTGSDPYQIFFGGNHPKITIRTAADTERKLLVIKDSYANCLIPFLIPDFAQITVIDARYYYDDLDMEMQSTEYTDVLFLYNVNTLSEDNCLVPVLNNEQGEDYVDSGEDVGSTEDVDSTEDVGSTENIDSTEDMTSSEDISSTEDNVSTEDSSSTEDNASTEDSSSTENGISTEDDSSIEDNTSTDDVSTGKTLTIEDVAFIGDSRTLSMTTGGKLEYALVPSSSVFATWGGKITDATAKNNTQNAADAHKKMAIFWFGINDVQSSDLNIRNDVTLFRSNYENLIDLYLQTNPDSKIVILSILTTSTQEKDYYEGQEDNIRAYNTALTTMCSEKGYSFLDVTHLFTGDNCFAEGDYIHFSKEWYETAFLPYISDALKLKLD